MAKNIRICFVGDSFVNGTQDESFLGWIGRVAVGLRATGSDLTTYNLGIRRDTSADILARWRSEAERRLPSHVDGRLVFSFGVNDCVEERGVRRVEAAATLRNAEQILAAALAWKPTLMVGPPAVAMTDQGAINDRIHSLSRGMEAICAKVRVPYVDLFGPLIDQPEWHRECSAGDGVHPAGKGYERIAHIVMASPVWTRWITATPAAAHLL